MAPHADFVEPNPKSNTASSLPMLHVCGNQIVDEHGNPTILRGAGIAGHLNMENFISGFTGHESSHRAAMAQVLGQEKAQYFFDRLLHYWFTDSDAEFYASIGLNSVRVPFNYRHFIDDQNPETLKQEGFALLDNIVEICTRHNLYVILDMHSVPGGQNQDWHCDSTIAKALFWEHKVFQDQAVNLWIAIAKHYAGNPVIAGYNPLNEPADPEHTRLVAFYNRLEKAIRSVDPDHMLFLDGNTYAMDFSRFNSILPNTVYACHDYAMLGFPIPGQAPYSGTEAQHANLRKQFNRKAAFSNEHGVPLWNGEFGPVYSDADKDPDAEATNEARLGVLRHQLSIYAETQTSWAIWLYKDIGYQGMVYVSPDSPYMKLIAPFVAKKQHLGLDFWGVVDKTGVAGTYEPFIDDLRAMVPEHIRNSTYPRTWSFDRHIERLVREGFLSDLLNLEFAELFRGKTKGELDELAASFRFENCVKRHGLNQVMREDAASGGK